MRILLLTHNLNGLGGNYMRASSLARELARLGHAVELHASRAQIGLSFRASETGGVRVLASPDFFPQRVRHGGLSPLDTAGRMIRVLQKQFDLVHSFDHRPAAFLPALLAKLRWNSILISDWADLWGWEGIGGDRKGIGRYLLTPWDHAWETRIRKFADGVTVVCQDLAARVIKQGVQPHRIHYLPPGADIDTIRPLPKRQSRLRMRLPLERPIVGFSGFTPYDQDLLVETMVELNRTLPEVHFATCGWVPPTMKSRLRSESFAQSFTDFGVLPFEEVGILLACADVLLLPYQDSSINRGRFPNKLGDYLAAGRAIVTNPTGDLGHLVKEEGLGVLAEPTPGSMSAALARVIRDPLLQSSLGTRARHFAEQSFNWTSRARQLNDFYQAITEQKAGALDC